MKFSDKLKNLRQENNLTQDELAEKIFVTRTAVSKWETDKGYPGIDSLKRISTLFNVSIDELISEEDLTNQNKLEKTRINKSYCFAMISLALTIVFALLVNVKKWFTIPTMLCMISYLIFAFLTKRKVSVQNKKYVIGRIIIFFVFGILAFVLLSFEIL